MPRQRAAGKKALGIYLTEAEHAQLKAIAHAQNCNVTDVIRNYLRALRLNENAPETTQQKKRHK